jgi:hypothetical protein
VKGLTADAHDHGDIRQQASRKLPHQHAHLPPVLLKGTFKRAPLLPQPDRLVDRAVPRVQFEARRRQRFLGTRHELRYPRRRTHRAGFGFPNTPLAGGFTPLEINAVRRATAARRARCSSVNAWRRIAAD